MRWGAIWICSSATSSYNNPIYNLLWPAHLNHQINRPLPPFLNGDHCSCTQGCPKIDQFLPWYSSPRVRRWYLDQNISPNLIQYLRTGLLLVAGPGLYMSRSKSITKARRWRIRTYSKRQIRFHPSQKKFAGKDRGGNLWFLAAPIQSPRKIIIEPPQI